MSEQEQPEQRREQQPEQHRERQSAPYERPAGAVNRHRDLAQVLAQMLQQRHDMHPLIAQM